VLLVRDHDYEKARSSIDRYEVENRDWPPRRPRERARHPESRVPIALFLALAAFFLVTGPVAGGSRWFQHGTAVTDLVLTSAPWRAVTALTLHADSGHAIGNVISGTIFVSAVSSRLGPGGATLAVLASGVLGNMANALYQHGIGNGDHRSIGASTAIFGAIGLLAATQIGLDHADKATAPRRFAAKVGPFIGGLALLVAFSLGGLSDLWADFMKASGAAERIFELMDRTPAVPTSGGERPASTAGSTSVSSDPPPGRRSPALRRNRPAAPSRAPGRA
jgi:membrane associated rhomboid family serine protease